MSTSNIIALNIQVIKTTKWEKYVGSKVALVRHTLNKILTLEDPDSMDRVHEIECRQALCESQDLISGHVTDIAAWAYYYWYNGQDRMANELFASLIEDSEYHPQIVLLLDQWLLGHQSGNVNIENDALDYLKSRPIYKPIVNWLKAFSLTARGKFYEAIHYWEQLESTIPIPNEMVLCYLQTNKLGAIIELLYKRLRLQKFSYEEPHQNEARHLCLLLCLVGKESESRVIFDDYIDKFDDDTFPFKIFSECRPGIMKLNWIMHDALPSIVYEQGILEHCTSYYSELTPLKQSWGMNSPYGYLVVSDDGLLISKKVDEPESIIKAGYEWILDTQEDLLFRVSQDLSYAIKLTGSWSRSILETSKYIIVTSDLEHGCGFYAFKVKNMKDSKYYHLPKELGINHIEEYGFHRNILIDGDTIILGCLEQTLIINLLNQEITSSGEIILFLSNKLIITHLKTEQSELRILDMDMNLIATYPAEIQQINDHHSIECHENFIFIQKNDGLHIIKVDIEQQKYTVSLLENNALEHSPVRSLNIVEVSYPKIVLGNDCNFYYLNLETDDCFKKELPAMPGNASFTEDGFIVSTITTELSVVYYFSYEGRLISFLPCGYVFNWMSPVKNNKFCIVDETGRILSITLS